MRILMLLVAVLSIGAAQAEQVQVRQGELVLNANLVKAGNWPEGPVLLMTHGTLAHGGMEIMATLQGLFREKGVSSLAPTLSLGLSDRSGMYPCDTPHTHKHADALGEIGLWLDWLRGQGVSDVVLLGHSRGGNQTAWFAAEHKDPSVRKIILIAPGVWEAGMWEADYEKRFKQPLSPLLERAQALVDGGKGDALMSETDFLYCPKTAATAATFISYYAPDARFDTPSWLRDIAVPALIVIGSEDRVVPELPARMESLGESEGLTVATIDGADHFFRDLYADELVEIALEFIND